MPHHLLATYRLALWIVVPGLVLVTVGPMEWRPSTSFPLKVERFLGIALVSMAFVLGRGARQEGNQYLDVVTLPSCQPGGPAMPMANQRY